MDKMHPAVKAHPLWPEFEKFMGEQNVLLRFGGDINAYWNTFLAGAGAERVRCAEVCRSVQRQDDRESSAGYTDGPARAADLIEGLS